MDTLVDQDSKTKNSSKFIDLFGEINNNQKSPKDKEE